MSKPNFLFFITDQHRADYLGCAGHPILRTPHIDAIAAQGTRFTSFHVATPVCMPNRASLLTGRYPSSHGLRYNGGELPYRARTFVELLRDAGYRTAAIGKSHVQPMIGAPPEPRRPDEPLEAWKGDGANYDHEDPSRYKGTEPYRIPVPYYGYDHVDMVTGHGYQCDGHYAQWLRARRPEADAWRANKFELPHGYVCPQAVRTPIPEELYPTSFIRDRAVEFLHEVKGDDRPFFAFVSFPDPHHPFSPPGHYWDLYDPKAFTASLPYESHRNPPPPMRVLHEAWKSGARIAQTPEAFMASEREIREAMALTCGMIGMIDDAIGAVLAALAASGREAETVVVFTSDHGDYLGDYNLLLKGALQLRSVTHVPFIWSDPQDRASRLCDALGSTVDLAPTILARAGITPYFGMQGRNLLDAMARGENPRARLLIEHQDSQTRMGFREPCLARTLVTKSHRLTMYKGEDWGELYDIEADPQESWNLWDEPRSAVSRCELLEALAQEMVANVDQSPRARKRA